MLRVLARSSARPHSYGGGCTAIRRGYCRVARVERVTGLLVKRGDCVLGEGKSFLANSSSLGPFRGPGIRCSASAAAQQPKDERRDKDISGNENRGTMKENEKEGSGGVGEGSKGADGGDAARVDRRVYRIAASSFLMGTAIGVVMPVMPMFASELGINTVQYGMLVSVMGLTRLLFNVPAAMAADRLGRKPLLAGGPLLSAVGMIGTSMANSLGELVGTRFMTGAGGSFQMAAGQAYLSDISTPANRARTISPMIAAFSAGAVVGPAIGGFLADSVGMRAPFLFVGTAMVGVAANNFFLTETRPQELIARSQACRTGAESPENCGIRAEFSRTVRQWKPLLKSRDIKGALFVQLSYWFASSGVMFTLMPLMANSFNISTASLGTYFSLIAVTNVVGAQPVAWLSDKYGRKPLIVSASGMLATSVGLMPFITTEHQLMGLVGLWAVGNTALGSTPTAYIADKTDASNRSQALALLRSAGDGGLMAGASILGTIAYATDTGVAMGVASGLLLAAGLNFAFRASESITRIASNPTIAKVVKRQGSNVDPK